MVAVTHRRSGVIHLVVDAPAGITACGRPWRRGGWDRRPLPVHETNCGRCLVTLAAITERSWAA